MVTNTPVMAVLSNADERDFANQIANALGYSHANVVVGTPSEAANALAAKTFPVPQYLLIDIAERGFDILAEIDALAEYCDADTRVVVMGAVNDVSFYRELRGRGIIEYFVRPAKISDIRAALTYDDDGIKAGKSSIISFMSAASGDGASTVALNVAYSLAKKFKQSTVLIDMDFQFGMAARSLDISSPFGIKELLEHPERGVDSTLLDRMTVEYDGCLKVIAAPNDLRYWPAIKPELIRDLIATLSQRYDFIILDLPHIWSTWIGAAISDSHEAVMVSQLWLRSVTHTSRIVNAWREIGIDDDNISIVINRSGAKFKEAINHKDFERVCGKKINSYLTNDIKSIVAAENEGKTVIEMGDTTLGIQLNELAAEILRKHKGNAAADKIEEGNASNNKKSGLSLASVFSKK